MKIKCILFFILFAGIVFGQGSIEIEGKIIGKTTKTPVLFANIYNKSFSRGTISNTDGYFRVSLKSLQDSVYITCIGYKSLIIQFREEKKFYLIELEENVQFLNEITVRPKDDSYLFDLLYECKKKIANYKVEAKAYYELKSFKNDVQVELVEGFYNAAIAGYELTDLQLKAGRLALRPYQNRFFASLESSRAITMLKLLERNPYFPANPFELSREQLKKSYYLLVDKEYLNNEGDSIYIIDYHPKDTTGLFFEGKIWIDKTKKNILKITLNCRKCKRYPFLPMFRTDSISNVSFQITKSFTAINDKMVFNHVDFSYVIDYKSRSRQTNELDYSITTNAILYAYDFSTAFFIPKFSFKDNTVGDYRKINGMPYNDFFWSNNNEYKLNDSKNSNELFFSDSNSITNNNLFKTNTYFKKGLFEHPYVVWSEKRTLFHEVTAISTVNGSSSLGFGADKYNIAIKIFVDINTYVDSAHVLTATILDPYESFYHLPLDSKTHCFINIYFDLCEIERRKLERKLKEAGNDILRQAELYNEFQKDFEIKRYKYFKAVNHGTNKQAMLKWNMDVYWQLGIDNIKTFDPYDK